MNNLTVTTNQTPIEIELGIDSKGMTTARNLYEFLELDKSNFAKWCKRNITENEFAEKGIDYVRLVLNDETPTGGRVERHDYKLTAKFAKKLSMTAKNQRGEQAREYFCTVEDKLKDVTTQYKQLSQQDIMRIQLNMIDDVSSRVDKLEDTMVIDYGQQRVLGRLVNNTVVTALGGKDSNAYREISKKVFSECNRDIKDHFDVNSRNNVPRIDFDEACTYIRNWRPCTNTQILIDDCNRQEAFV